jgi:hypothetical protein
VQLEGLEEVVVIVVSFAARGHSLGVRVAAAGLAVLLVTLAGRTAVESTLRVHLEPYFGERGIATVTREDMEDLPTLMEGKVGPATAWRGEQAQRQRLLVRLLLVLSGRVEFDC